MYIFRYDTRSPAWRANGSIWWSADGFPRATDVGANDAPTLQMIRRVGLGGGDRSAAPSCRAAGVSSGRGGRRAAARGRCLAAAQVIQSASRLFVKPTGIYHFLCSTLSRFSTFSCTQTRKIHTNISMLYDFDRRDAVFHAESSLFL